MIFADRDDFDRAHYDFKYVHREFLGDVRCIVFDVTPKKDAGKGRFLGRIWVEDQDYNIVRLNGTYAPAAAQRAVLPHGQLAPEPDSGLLGPGLYLQRRRRLQLRLEGQDGFQGADPHLGL